MTEIIDFLRGPWPWYVAGPIIGLTVPLLLLIGNKSFGISSNLRHLCAIALPSRAKPEFLRYDWRGSRWNLAFAGGLVLGGFLAGVVLPSPTPTDLSPAAVESLRSLGVEVGPGLIPPVLTDLLNLRSLLLLTVSGLLVGFGTRWAGGCTSGHAITGLSTLQAPSLIATLCFFAGGVFSANVLLPLVLR